MAAEVETEPTLAAPTVVERMRLDRDVAIKSVRGDDPELTRRIGNVSAAACTCASWNVPRYRCWAF